MKRWIPTLLLAVFTPLLFAQPGSPDATFGINGVAWHPISYYSIGSEMGTDMLPMADGRLLVCGHERSNPTEPSPFIMRLLPDGSLDPDYGIVSLSCGDRGEAWAMAFAPDSSVYLCGYADTLGYDRITLWHVLPDGTPDPAFGYYGRASVVLGTYNVLIWDMAVQTDGKLVLAGCTNNSQRNALLVRLNTDGTLDNTFFTVGWQLINLSNALNDEFLAVDVLDDGSIVAGGYGTSGGTVEFPALVKFTPSGALDVTFDGDGILQPTTSYPDSRITCMAADGQYILAGGAKKMGIVTTSDYYLLRLDDTGTPDPLFGTLGEQVTDVAPDDFLNDLILLNDGRIVVTGFAGDATNYSGELDILTAVHNADGSLYTAFGGTGHVLAALPAGQDRGYAVRAQPDGKLVVSGYSNVSVVVLRYENDLNTSLTAKPAASALGASPVPFDRELVLTGTKAGDGYRMIDATGRIVASGPSFNGQTVVEAAGLASGAYTISSGRSVLRVMKN